MALDAGGLTNALTLEEQQGIGHVIVSHTHLDHNCGTRSVIESLKAHMFNDDLWPDFTKLPSPDVPTSSVFSGQCVWSSG